MAFVNASLLFGGMLMAVPVILHLVMRQKPRSLLFPAIRFIQQRRESNRRTLRLRHWLLLLLRALLIVLLAAAIARPSVDSNHWGNWVVIALVSLLFLLVLAATVSSWLNARGRILVGLLLLFTLLLATGDLVLMARVFDRDGEAMLGDQEAPVAAVLVIDSSQRMGYKHENLSRLEKAQQTANWLVQQLPSDSEVAVLGSSGRQQVFAIDLAAASADAAHCRKLTSAAQTELKQALGTDKYAEQEAKRRSRMVENMEQRCKLRNKASRFNTWKDNVQRGKDSGVRASPEELEAAREAAKAEADERLREVQEAQEREMARVKQEAADAQEKVRQEQLRAAQRAEDAALADPEVACFLFAVGGNGWETNLYQTFVRRRQR